MKSDQMTDNRRILVIDDNVSIHEDFRRILMPPDGSNGLDQARAALFGEASAPRPSESFVVDFAGQGESGFRMAKNAAGSGTPYALAFVDMRMPPDGTDWKHADMCGKPTETLRS